MNARETSYYAEILHRAGLTTLVSPEQAREIANNFITNRYSDSDPIDEVWERGIIFWATTMPRKRGESK